MRDKNFSSVMPKPQGLNSYQMRNQLYLLINANVEQLKLIIAEARKQLNLKINSSSDEVAHYNTVYNDADEQEVLFGGN